MKSRDREQQICQRLREAREFLGITQQGCALQLGIQRSTLVNYENGRSPVRVGLALRFCRQFIISEEWLATGRYEACHEAAKAHGQGWNREMDEKVFRRQCMDLLSEPEVFRMPTNILYSQAYDQALASIYAKTVRQFFYNPRIVLNDSDHPQLCTNLLTAIHGRHLLLLTSEALRLKKLPTAVTRAYTRCVFQASDLVARKFMGARLTPQMLKSLAWLRAATTDPTIALGPLLVEVEPQEREQAIPMRKGEPIPS